MNFWEDVHSAKILDSLYESQAERIRKLEAELAYWRPLGRRFLDIKLALTLSEPEE